MTRPVIFIFLNLLVLIFAINVSGEERIYAGLTLTEIFPDQAVRQLAVAAENGDINEINKLIKQGVKVNYAGKYGITPLWWPLTAFYYTSNPKCYDGFACLLKNGADPNVQIKGGYDNVMYVAAEVNDTRFLAAAVNAGGNVNLVSKPDLSLSSAPLSAGATPIFGAILIQSRANIQFLVSHGANLNVRESNFGNTPMMCAGMLNDFEDVYYLLLKGADPTIKNNSGLTIIWCTAHSRVSLQSDAGKWLLKVIDLLQKKGVL